MTNPLEQIRELAVSLSKECGESDKDSRIRVATVRFFLKKMLAILDASQDYVCVPVDPTDAMVDAWVAAEIPPIIGNDEAVNRAVCTADWKAMLAASKETNRE